MHRFKGKDYLIIPNDTGYSFGVIAGPSLGRSHDELWGPLATQREAQDFIASLKAEFSDYEYFRVVKIETPEVMPAIPKKKARKGVIVMPTGKTRRIPVYLQQGAGEHGKGFWATRSEANSDTGWTLDRDGDRVVRERYEAQTNERLESEVVIGAYWDVEA